MFLKISLLVLLILYYLTNISGYKLFENDQSLIMTKFQIKPKIILPDHHELIRRSNTNQKKYGRDSEPSSPAPAPAPASASTPVTEAFQKADGHSIFVTLIHRKSDFATPFFSRSLKKVVCLLDFAVTEIIDKDKKLTSSGNFIYFELHKTAGFLKDKIEQQLSEVQIKFITEQYGSWNDKTILMPLYRENDYAAVLLAEIKSLMFIYYDPMDPEVKNLKTRKDALEMLRRFLILVGNRNKKVAEAQKILTFGWRFKQLRDVPRIPNKRQGDTDFGINALQFIDFILNDKLSFKNEPNSKVYKDEVINQLKKKVDYEKWHKKQQDKTNKNN